MFGGKRTRIALALMALLFVSLALALIVFPSLLFIFFPSRLAGTEPAMTPIVWPVESNVELNQSQGFGFSLMVAGDNSSPMVVLPPGGSGTIPFTLSSPPVNVSVQVSLSMSLGSGNTTNATPGVHFNIFPTNFTLNPGQQVKSTLTITVDQDAPSAYYSPVIAIETNTQKSPPYVGGGGVELPSLLIATQVPSCLYLVNEQLIPSSVLVWNTPASGNATWPLFVPSPYVLPDVSPINLSPGETTSVIFGCFTTVPFPLTPGQSPMAEADPLRMNVTASEGLTAQFSSAPTDIVWGGSGSMYSVTVTASVSLNAGNYQVKGQASLGSHLFDWHITYTVS